MELKFIRRWKFSTRNMNHSLAPADIMRAQIIRRDNDDDRDARNGRNDRDADRDSDDNSTDSEEEDEEVDVLNYFSLFKKHTYDMG